MIEEAGPEIIYLPHIGDVHTDHQITHKAVIASTKSFRSSGIRKILAYETGVTRVADPLGGSYYVESLTDKIEEEVKHFLGKIDEVGGLFKAIEKISGY